MDRTKFDNVSLKHYDKSVLYFFNSLVFGTVFIISKIFSLILKSKGFVLNTLISIKITMISYLIIGVLEMLLFIYDYYLGQRIRKERS